jgi:hypothetical protein
MGAAGLQQARVHLSQLTCVGTSEREVSVTSGRGPGGSTTRLLDLGPVSWKLRPSPEYTAGVLGELLAPD